MEPIGTHGLSCLGEQDYADYARYMQCQAQAIDATLFAQQTALESLLNRPSIMVRPSANRTIASGVVINDLYNEIEYINNTFMTVTALGTETFINIGSPVGTAVVPYLTGMYMVGGAMAMDATGAVTASSQRNLFVEAVDDTQGVLTIGQFRDVNPDMNTAITNIHCNGAFTMVLRGTNGVRIRTAASHTNAASTVTIAQSATRLWVTYLGPEDLVEVA